MILTHWAKNRRRRQLLAQPFPTEWQNRLAQNVRHYRFLAPEQQVRVQDVVRVLLAEKTWVRGAGFVVTDEMKVTVAAQASLLVLGFDRPYYYDALRTVVLYPGTYSNPHLIAKEGEVIPEALRTYGEMWAHGTVVLSWEEILACGRAGGNGRNLVLHELAHYFDMLDRYADGVPFLAGSEKRDSWERVVDAEFRRLVGSAKRREKTLLDQYGTWNKAEFFAVATECFFELPKAMRQQHSELHSVLRDLYRQDPGEWLPDARTPQRRREPDLEDVGDGVPLKSPDAGNADELLTTAFDAVNRGQFDLAIKAATRLIALDPGEAEAHHVRARAFLELREYERSLAQVAQFGLQRWPSAQPRAAGGLSGQLSTLHFL
ncbi:MAG: zinc-dependent peptidase, partial [Planctomycetes bacterium]|nr:zinc-dependent peptidase [Planctomycetota bacterium]